MMMNNTSHGKQMAQYVHPYNPIPTIHNFPSSDFTNYPYNRRHCTIPTNSYCCLKLFLLWSRSTQLPYGVNPLWLRWKGLYEVNLKYGCLDETFLDYIYFFICIWWTNVVMDKFVTNVVMVTNPRHWHYARHFIATVLKFKNLIATMLKREENLKRVFSVCHQMFLLLCIFFLLPLLFGLWDPRKSRSSTTYPLCFLCGESL